MLQFDVLSVLRVHSCAFWMKAADVWSAVGELLCPAMADCAVRLVRVAGQCVRAKHGLHSSFWTSCYGSPNCCQVWKLHCLFKQFPRSSRFGKQDHLPAEWRDAVGNKDKVNTVAAFYVPESEILGLSWCLSGLGLRREVYVADKSDGDCSAASEPEVWLWIFQEVTSKKPETNTANSVSSGLNSCRIVILSLQTTAFYG